MRTTRKILWGVSALVVGLLILAAGCGLAPIDYEGTPFYSAARSTAPVFDAAASREITPKAEWTWGNPVYETYNLLKEYGGENDTNTGLDNIYKALYQAGSFYEDFMSSASEFTTAQAITPTYDFSAGANNAEYGAVADDASGISYTGGTDGTSSDKSYSFAYKESGDELWGLITWKSASTDAEYGVMQGYHNEATGDVEMHMAFYMDYATDPDFAIRIWVKGNENTGVFSLKMRKQNASGYYVTVAGNGKSKGTAADSYFILKVQDETTVPAGTYYKIEADAMSEADMQALAVAGITPDGTNDPESYNVTVDSLGMYASGDLPSSSASFSNNNILALP